MAGGMVGGARRERGSSEPVCKMVFKLLEVQLLGILSILGVLFQAIFFLIVTWQFNLSWDVNVRAIWTQPYISIQKGDTADPKVHVTSQALIGVLKEEYVQLYDNLGNSQNKRPFIKLLSVNLNLSCSRLPLQVASQTLNTVANVTCEVTRLLIVGFLVKANAASVITLVTGLKTATQGRQRN